MSAGRHLPAGPSRPAEAGIARQTLVKWHARWETDGEDGLCGLSFTSASGLDQVDHEVQDVMVYLGRNIKLGPVMLAAELTEFGIALAASTLYRGRVRGRVRHGIPAVAEPRRHRRAAAPAGQALRALMPG